jgi:hypothetical protein
MRAKWFETAFSDQRYMACSVLLEGGAEADKGTATDDRPDAPFHYYYDQ